MLIVETIAKIRRAHFVQGKAIKAIVRELRVSRKVVRKVIRSEATEFQYEREEQAREKHAVLLIDARFPVGEELVQVSPRRITGLGVA